MMLLVQSAGEVLVVEDRLRTRLAIVEIAANAPDDHVAAPLGGHLLELDLAHAAIRVHYADCDSVDVAEPLECGFAGVARCCHQDHMGVIELSPLAQLGSAGAEETRKALQRHVFEGACRTMPELQHVDAVGQ